VRLRLVFTLLANRFANICQHFANMLSLIHDWHNANAFCTTGGSELLHRLLPDYRLDPLGGHLLKSRSDVAIKIDGDSDRRVPQALLDYLGVDSGG
jgi:hypothetical protein